MMVMEDHHDLSPKGPFVTDVRCDACNGVAGGLRLVGDVFYHRKPSRCIEHIERFARMTSRRKR